MEPRPYLIQLGDDVLADLRERLARTRWPDEPPDAGWQYGADLAYVRRLAAYWRRGYDWRASEATLNAFRQYTVPLAGIDLHFLHQPGVGPDPLPLLLSHGWPGSVWEFYKLIPLLTDPARHGGDAADAFTVVAPSLPGYGFSFRPGQPRFGVAEIARTFATLMTDVLGYARFGAQGGDWGAFIAARLGADVPQRLHGIHLNLLPIRREPDRLAGGSEEERRFAEELREWLREETGYQAIQGTRPQTLAFGLTDSPAGLLAWLVEKFRAWSDCDGDPERAFTRDEILANATIYWATGAIGSSFWPYYDRLHAGWPLPEGRITVPTGYAAFPREILRPPRTVAERAFNIRHWTPMAAGGHFAALEQPEALAGDIRAFFRPFRA
ncbi:MAG: epoxide hydrolase 1 [Chloroflexota bacterium]|nr:epoxide hydrolase 1 [Chloroflexota bacterium]